MRHCLLLMAANLFLGFYAHCAEADATVGPEYDSKGNLLCYKYADGTRDLYTYDNSWRMVKFTGRGGDIVSFSYLEDGTMVTLRPDGTKLTSPSK